MEWIRTADKRPNEGQKVLVANEEEFDNPDECIYSDYIFWCKYDGMREGEYWKPVIKEKYVNPWDE